MDIFVAGSSLLPKGETRHLNRLPVQSLLVIYQVTYSVGPQVDEAQHTEDLCASWRISVSVIYVRALWGNANLPDGTAAICERRDKSRQKSMLAVTW